MKSYKRQFIEKHCYVMGYQRPSEKLDEIEQELLEAIEKDGWISVKDKYPKEGDRILIWGIFNMGSDYQGHRGDIYIGALYDNGRFYANAIQLLGVTHWMKLPNPPMKADNDKK